MYILQHTKKQKEATFYAYHGNKWDNHTSVMKYINIMYAAIAKNSDERTNILYVCVSHSDRINLLLARKLYVVENSPLRANPKC